MCNQTGGTRTPSQRPQQTMFASTKVPKFAGVTSWEQYCLVFDVILQSNEWDDPTAALQLLSHLEGDALNVVLLVPETQRASHDDLVRALSAYYRSTGQLADYRRQFERITRRPEEDPSIFAVALETFAMNAFGDMGIAARLRILRDRFIAGQDCCELRRHLDSVASETPIRDIVDRCRVWESHADSVDGRGRKPKPERALPIYVVEDVGEAGDDLPVSAVTVSPTAPELLEALLRRLLPTPVVQPPDLTPVPSELALLLQQLLGYARPAQPAPSGKSGITVMETLLLNLLPVRPESLCTAGCRKPGLDCCVVFFVWKPGPWGHQMSHIGHYVPLLAAGMEGREGREQICYDLPSCSGGAPLGGKRRLIRGGGSASRISNGTGPQNPGGGGETWLTASREQPIQRGLVDASEETEIAGVVADVA